MAKTTINARQLTITGSAKAMSNMQTSLSDNAVFMMQVSGGSDPVQLIKAQDMQNYFSDIDVDSVSSGTYTLVFIDPTAPDGVTGGFDFKYDSDGTSGLKYEPASNTLSLSGAIALIKDSGSISFGADSDVVLKHVADDGLLLSGSNFASASLQFGDSATKIVQSADGQLDIDADTEVEITAPTVHIVASSAIDADVGGFDVDASGKISLSSSYSSLAHEIQLAGELDLDTREALNINAHTTLNLHASSSMTISGSTLNIDASSGNADIDAVGQLLLGAANATKVEISKPSVETDIQGTLSVDQAAVFDSNVTIAGNLTVQGSTTQLDTTNLLVEDALIQLGSSSAGNAAADGDRGFVFSLSSSANQAFWWDQSQSEFKLAPVTGSGADSSLTLSGSEYSALRVGAFVAEGHIDLGSTDADTVTFVADVDSDIIPDADGSRTLGASSSEWAKLFVNDVESENGALDLIATQINVSGNLTVSGSTADFYNLGAYANTDYNAADGFMVRDASASTAKHMTFAELGQYLVRGTSETATDSNGIQVSADGVLSIDYQERQFVSGGANITAAQTASIAHSYTDAVVQKSLAVYLNGMLQLQSGSIAGNLGDYRMDGTSVIMTESLDSDDVLVVRYIKK